MIRAAKVSAGLDTRAILDFLRMDRERPSHDYLRRLLVAYRDRVPYETATRLLRYRDIKNPEERVRYPAEFWREKLALGAGGSCSDSAYAFKKFLDALGFDCSMAVGSEGEVARDAEGNVLGFPTELSHCSVVVGFDRDRYVADPCCGNYVKVPLPLDVAELTVIAGKTEEGRPYRYAVEPLGEAFYEIHNLGPDGGEYPGKSQAYIFRDRAFSDGEFEEHMRYGYREGYSSDHLSFVAGDPETKVEHRFSTHSGRLWRSGRGPWEEVPLGEDPVAVLSGASKLPRNLLEEALEYLLTEGGATRTQPAGLAARDDRQEKESFLIQDRNDRSKVARPLAATLERLSVIEADDEEMQLSARLGVSDGRGWVTVAGLAERPDLLEDLMVRLGREHGSGNRAYAGTTLLRDYLWRMLSTAAATLLSEKRVPDLAADNVALRFGGEGFVEELAFLAPRFAALPGDPDAGHPDATVVRSVEDLLGRIRDALAGTHMPALVPAVRALRVRRGTRVLQRAASDVVAEAFMFVGRDLGREAEGCALAEKLLSVPSPISAPTNYYTLEYPGGAEKTRVRHTCCLYYKVADGCCFTCPRKSDEERVKDLAEEAAREGEAS